MARFKGTVRGNRGSVSRLGHGGVGLETTANGWNTGCRVHIGAGYGDNSIQDVINVYINNGSEGGGDRLVHTVRDGKIEYNLLGLEESATTMTIDTETETYT